IKGIAAIVAGLAIAICLGIFLAAQASRQVVIAELKHAVEKGDVGTIMDRVDWPGLSAWLKADLAARAEQAKANPVLGQSVKLRPARVPDIVDYYVRPENTAIPVAYRPAMFPDVPV